VLGAVSRYSHARLDYIAAQKQIAAAKKADEQGVGGWMDGGEEGGGVWPPPLKVRMFVCVLQCVAMCCNVCCGVFQQSVLQCFVICKDCGMRVFVCVFIVMWA